MQSSFGNRLAEILASKSQLCVGLDPSFDQLNKWELEFSAQGAEQFCIEILDACQNKVAMVKPQVSFFEQFGSVGYAALERVLQRAISQGFLVIADGKRGDIGTTMDGYARAWLSTDAPFLADAVTVSPYLGPDSLEQFCRFALQNQKGVFVLAATSNQEASSLQSALAPGETTVAGSVAVFAKQFTAKELGSVGVVLGAETDLGAMGIESNDLADMPILAPGFGAQGANLSDAKALFGSLAPNVIFSVSRSVAGESLSGLRDRVQSAIEALEIGLST